MSELFGQNLVLPPQQQAIRDKCYHPSGNFREFRMEEIEQSIPNRFEEQVRLFPSRLAVHSTDLKLTYEALNQESNRIARAIFDQLGEESEPVVLLLGQGAQSIAAMLGALKAGKFFVLVDPTFPPTRIRHILEDSQARAVVTNSENLNAATELITKKTKLINIQSIDGAVPRDNLNLPISPDSAASIIYTSGSAGQPKGVVQSHRNYLSYSRHRTNEFHLCAEDRCSLLSYGTGQAMIIIFCALSNGAALYSLNVKEDGVTFLASWLTRHEVTIYMSGSPLFRHFAETLSGQEEFPKLRLVRLASQTVLKSDVDLYKAHLPADCIFATGLSSSETGMVLNYFIDKEIQITTRSVPVGFPLDGNEVLLLDEDGNEVGFNQMGEITVKSRYLALGYWGKPELTKESFRPCLSEGNQRIYRMGDLGRKLPDGSLELLGRKDFQVKVRGYRVQVTEIESRLMELSGVKEAIVVGQEDASGNQRLVAYVVPSGPQVPAATELRHFLSSNLPDYMVPAAFVFLEVMPQTLNGKVNRQALPAPGTARPELESPFVASSTPTEEVLVKIWAEVLRLDQVGIYDNFLELGGDSLLASQVIARVIKTFQVEVPLRSLWGSPTVAEMAEIIVQGQVKAANQEAVQRMLSELESFPEASP